MTNYAPIAIFCFNRPHILQQTLTALAANHGAKHSDITFFCDGPRHAEEKKLTDATRNIARKTHGFASVTVIEREQNMGCAASIIDGLTQMFTKYERLITIEDDILTSPHTLEYLNKGLTLYKDTPEIFSISSFSYPAHEMPIPSDYKYDVYIAPRFNCWGWASWRDRFEQIDWKILDYNTFKNSSQLRQAFNAGGADLSPMLDDQMNGRIDAWDIRADYTRFKLSMYNIQPIISYSTNLDTKSGTHGGFFSKSHHNNIFLAKPTQELHWLNTFKLDPKLHKNYYAITSSEILSLRHKTITLIKPILNRLGLWELLRKFYRKIIS